MCLLVKLFGSPTSVVVTLYKATTGHCDPVITAYFKDAYLFKVSASDPDKDRDRGIEYMLSQGDDTITNLFSINSATGELTLTGKLDRDRPSGREIYQFNILAVDEPGSDTRLTGYATVQIFPIDINDNSPIFDANTLTGTVPEMTETSKWCYKSVDVVYYRAFGILACWMNVLGANPYQC